MSHPTPPTQGPLDAPALAVLPQSEATYRTLFESIDQGFCIVALIYDPAGNPIDYRFEATNNVFERQTGYANAKGRRARELAPNLPQAWIDTIHQVAKTGQALRTNAFFADPARWYAISLCRLDNDAPGLVAGLFDDITAVKQAQADRHQSEERAQFLLALSDAMRSLADPVSIQLATTRLALDYFRADRAYYCEVQGSQVRVQQHDARPDLPPIPTSYSLDQLPSMKAMLVQGKPVVIDDVTTSNGLDPVLKQLCQQLRIQAYIQVPLIKQGQLVAKFCVTQDQPRTWTSLDLQLATETAERIWDATQRAHTEAALRESETKYRLLFESIDEGFCQIQLLYDAQGQPIDWVYLAANPTFERQVGLNPIGRRVSQVVGPVEAYWLTFYHQVVLSQQPARTENYVAALNRWYTIYASPVAAADQLTVVFDDCSARKQLEAALRLADQRKDEFLAMLAHELRNPLSVLRNGLQILTLTEPTDEPTQATLGLLTRQTNQLVGMVDDLLDVSRISQGKITIRTERLNLVELVSQTTEALGPLFEQRSLRLTLSLPTTAVYVAGDETRLGQVVTNLLTNAARYTPAGGQVWLSLSVVVPSTAHPRAMLQVGDTGIGLAADQLKAIFELFVQIDTSLARAQGGLGVGLTLVKRLVELHGGEIVAQSAGLGQGSTFSVYLPVLAGTWSVALADQVPASTGARPRILVIDDNADAALTLRLLLQKKGYDAHSQTSGRAGLAAAERLQPAAILLDIGMPELDGYATCRLIREQAWGHSVVVVALTGYGQAADRERSQAAGFDGHLVKPVDLGVLIELLTALLDAQGRSLA